MEFKGFQEQVFFAVTRIALQNPENGRESTATGFIVEVPLKGDRSLFLLVSNKHVYDENHPILLSFHKKTEDGNPNLEENLTFKLENYIERIYRHPNPNIDLAALNISSAFNRNLYVRAIKHSMLSNFMNENLMPGEAVWFAGYPQGLYDTKYNLPLLRRGYIATIPRVHFEGKPAFLIDAHVHLGSSGSPVFWNYQGTFELLGVISETMVISEQIKAPQLRWKVSVAQSLGLGVVIKSTCVKELITHTLKCLELDGE